MSDFPILDLAAFQRADSIGQQRIGADIDRICRDTGFLAVKNHRVPQPTIDAAWLAVRGFFDQEVSEKQKSAANGAPYGYLRSGTEALAKSRGEDTPPDLKESFNSGPPVTPTGMTDPDARAFCYASTPWPKLVGFQSSWAAYYREMETLAAQVMQVFAVALDLNIQFFSPFIDAPVSALRALNYPASDTAPHAGQQRAGAHTDYGSLTILLPEPDSEGLEVQTQGAWVSVPPIPGAFVINIGDLMARWTNDRWRSTLHRVVVPAPQVRNRRQSLAFFHQPNWGAEIACLSSCQGAGAIYEPVLSGPYLMGKFRAATT